jgi:tryptophan-rich sensory protein
MKFYTYLLLALILCVGGGWLTGLVTREGINNWYNYLIRPASTPPNFVFPIVWTFLYILMAISLALFLSSPHPGKKTAIVFFGLQLILNFSWSWLFFGMRSPGLALIDLILLWICIIATILSFRKHSVLSAYLFIPYLAWVTYAGYLNLFIWLNNSPYAKIVVF